MGLKKIREYRSSVTPLNRFQLGFPNNTAPTNAHSEKDKESRQQGPHNQPNIERRMMAQGSCVGQV